MVSLETSAQWKEWFDDWQTTVAADGRMTPIVVGRDNHKSSNDVPETLFNASKGVYYALSFGCNLLRM